MAQIITYPKLSTLANNDLLIVSDVSSVNKTTNSLEVDTLAQHIIVTNNVITGGGTIRQIPMFTPTGVIIGDSIMRQNLGNTEIQLGGSLDVTANVNIDQDLDVSGNVNIQSLSAGYLPFPNYAGGDLEDSQLQQSPQLSNGLYQMKFRNADRFIIDKPSSTTSGDPEYLIQQDGNYKVSFGWDDDGAGFGYIYNWAGNGLRLGAAGQNPQFELDTVVPQIISHTAHLFDGTAQFEQNIQVNAAIEDGLGNTGTAGQVLSSTVTGVEWVSNGGGTVTGTGTTNTLPLWSDGPASVLSDSIVTQSSGPTKITVAGGVDVNAKLDVSGDAGIAGTFIGNDIEIYGLSQFFGNSEFSGQVQILNTSPQFACQAPSFFFNTVSVGVNNVTLVPGLESMAIGSGNTVLQGNSLASGNNCTSNAFGAFAGGGGSQANGIVAIAYGNNVQANGINSAAFGGTTTASGNFSFAVGDSATASGQNSMALGGDALAQDSLAGPGVTVNTADYAGFQNLLLANYASLNYTSDATAAAGGVPLGGIYHNAGDVKIRLV